MRIYRVDNHRSFSFLVESKISASTSVFEDEESNLYYHVYQIVTNNIYNNRYSIFF